MTRFNPKHNKKRFDLYSFYSLLAKCKITELLDHRGKTPFDSELINKCVAAYNAYVSKDVQNIGNSLPYANSASVKQFLYSLDSVDGIDNITNNITTGFDRKYYTLPLSDSEGVLEHTNVYTFLKSHFDRWLKFDPYERYKLSSRIADLLNEDSDIRNRYGDQFLIACEKDSDLSRRLTELHSNVLQTDSEVRNEILLTTLTALRGLTPGGDSDAAKDLGHIITAVLNNNSDSDSDIRNKFAWYFIKALRFDSDQADSDLQVRLGEIISNTELEYLESPVVYTRSLLPMDGNNTGNIGDSDTRWALGNFTTLRSDNVKIRNSNKDNLIVVADSEGRLEPTNYGDTNFYKGIEWRSDSELYINAYYAKANNKVNTREMQVTSLSKDRVVIVGDSEGSLSQLNYLQWQENNTLNIVDRINATGKIKVSNVKSSGFTSFNNAVYIIDSEGTLGNTVGFKDIDVNPDSDFVTSGNVTVSNHSLFDGIAINDLSNNKLVISNNTEGKLANSFFLNWVGDSDNPLQLNGKKIIAIDSDTFYNLLIKNQELYTIDSDKVAGIITDTPVKSDTSWVIGQRGDVYFIDSDQSNKIQTKSLVYTSDKIVDTPAELNRATNDRVTKLQIFNSWYRFSHQYVSGATPGTYTYPYNVSELNGWAIDLVTDKIYTTVNANSYCGFVSPDTYQNFTFNSTYKTYNDNTNDDDVISSIIGFVTEGIFGQPGYREHTLQVIRNSGGFPMLTQNYGSLGPVCWALVYNYNQDDVRLLVNKTTSAPVATAPWNSYPYGTKVWIRRSGDIIKAYCSQMNDSTYTLDSDTEIIWDLSSDSDTIKFRGPVRYGYGVHSQKGASWNDTFFKPDQGKYLHYITDGSLASTGGNVYQYSNDSEQWILDNTLTIDNTVGNRLLHNTSTGKTFYNNPEDDTVYQIMTSRKFSDIINLPALTAEPDSDILGFEGLKPGTFALADGVNWDPVSYGAPAYTVFWDGEYWYYVDAQ
jgi:hypothetical protein